MENKVRKNVIRILLDIGMIVLFVLLFNTLVTGLLFHEIVGLVVLGVVGAHIIINKNWELLFIITYLCINSLFDHSIFESKIFLTILTLFMFFTYSYRVEKNLYMDNN